MFGKAKINRFNEAKVNTPGTPSNNVKNKLKAFVENRNKCRTPSQEKNKDKSVGSNTKKTEIKDDDNKENKNKEKTKSSHDECKSEKSSTISDFGSMKSTPLFRTPSLMKYKKLALISTPKSKHNNSPKKNIEFEVLQAKMVECKNKDAYIQDLSEQIDDIRNKMQQLQNEKDQFESEKKEEIERLQYKHNEDLVNMTIRFEMEIAEMNVEKNKLIDELTRTKEEYDEFIQMSANQASNIKEDCKLIKVAHETSKNNFAELLDDKDKEIESIRSQLLLTEKNCSAIQEKHALEVESLKREYQKEIEYLEFELLKTMTELQKEKENTVCKVEEIEQKMEQELCKIRAAFEVEKQQIISETETRLKQGQENNCYDININETEMNEKLKQIESEWKLKLENLEKESAAILKECQAISEYSIIQCEVEKNKIKVALDEKTEELDGLKVIYEKVIKGYEQLKIKYKEIQHEMAKIVLELNDTRKNSHEEIQQKKKEIDYLTKDKITYELTIKNAQNTIDVLKKRLIHSDRDVEQLKNELEQNEKKIIDYEQKNLQLTQQLKEAQTVNEEVELQYESATRLNCVEINKLGTDLLKKLEIYRKDGSKLNKQVSEANKLREEAMEQLHSAMKAMEQLKQELKFLATINTQYEFEIEQSQNELEDYHMRELEWSDTRDKLEGTIVEMQTLLEEKMCELDSLKNQSLCNQEKSDFDHPYLEYYENKIKEYEDELRECSSINKKYIEMSGRYDQISQKFEQLELDNIENNNKISNLMAKLETKAVLEEESLKQKAEYDKLRKKYEELKKETINYKDREVEMLANHDSEKEILKTKIQHLENSFKDVSQKYADLLGHKKNKQKKKHLVELKNEKEELMQNNMDLDIKLTTQLKTIEKLKRENNDLRKSIRRPKVVSDDKENIGSPNRSLNTSRIESPFRDRN